MSRKERNSMLKKLWGRHIGVNLCPVWEKKLQVAVTGGMAEDGAKGRSRSLTLIIETKGGH